MRELALVLPERRLADQPQRVALRPGSVKPGAKAAGPARRVPGPALELSGCATGQEAVAGFVTALKDIDGVTRVGVEVLGAARRGQRLGQPGGEGGSDDCRTPRLHRPVRDRRRLRRGAGARCSRQAPEGELPTANQLRRSAAEAESAKPTEVRGE